jgi:DNA modification methylase
MKLSTPSQTEWVNQVHFGDCRDSLRAMASAGVRVRTCVTSPPYFGLRDYGHEGQIGLEETPEQFIAQLVEVFRCVRDVLADDGTLWVNIGDSYCSTAPGTRNAPQSKGSTARPEQWANARPKTPEGMKPKDLIGIPWMLAFALRDDGAASPAHMRLIEEVISTVTASYEYRAQWPDRLAALVERLEREHVDANRGGWYLRQDIIWHKPNPMPESVTDRCTKAHEYVFLLSKGPRYFYDHEAVKEQAVSDKPAGNKSHKYADAYAAGSSEEHRTKAGLKALAGVEWETRNRRSVWTIATKPYKGAHFAVFPPALVEPCILAGSRSRDVVLDPFMGSGTTAAVAIAHGRQFIGCELNPDYKPLQDERIKGAHSALAEAQAAIELAARQRELFVEAT